MWKKWRWGRLEKIPLSHDPPQRITSGTEVALAPVSVNLPPPWWSGSRIFVQWYSNENSMVWRVQTQLPRSCAKHDQGCGLGIFGQPLFPPGSGRVQVASMFYIHLSAQGKAPVKLLRHARCHMLLRVLRCVSTMQEMRCQGQPACAVLFKMTMQQECASISQRGVNGGFLKWGTVPPNHPCWYDFLL